MNKIILASQSRSRANLLKAAGFDSLIQIPSNIDESEIKKHFTGDNTDLALALAEAKALKVSNDHSDAWVIAADQILVFENQIFDKAASIAEAKALLQKLRGRTHHLLGGHALAKAGAIMWRHLSRVELTFCNFSDALLENYIAHMGENVLTCVGGYQLEGLAVQLFSEVKGDYFSVLGLDMLALLHALRDQGAIAK